MAPGGGPASAGGVLGITGGQGLRQAGWHWSQLPASSSFHPATTGEGGLYWGQMEASGDKRRQTYIGGGIVRSLAGRISALYSIVGWRLVCSSVPLLGLEHVGPVALLGSGCLCATLSPSWVWSMRIPSPSWGRGVCSSVPLLGLEHVNPVALLGLGCLCAALSPSWVWSMWTLSPSWGWGVCMTSVPSWVGGLWAWGSSE